MNVLLYLILFFKKDINAKVGQTSAALISDYLDKPLERLQQYKSFLQVI